MTIKTVTTAVLHSITYFSHQGIMAAQTILLHHTLSEIGYTDIFISTGQNCQQILGACIRFIDSTPQNIIWHMT